DGIRSFHVTGVQTCALPISDTVLRPGGAYELRGLRIDVQAPEVSSPLGMPGLFPGRVVQVTHARAFDGPRISPASVRTMVERGKIGRASCMERRRSGAAAEC